MEKGSKKRNKANAGVGGKSPSPTKRTKIEPSSATESSPVHAEVSNGNKVLNWDKFDIEMLLVNIEAQLPKSDHLKFTTAVEKFNWGNVAFKSYTAQDCKEKWNEIQSRLRRFRTLTDMVHDAKEWVKTPWITHTAYKRTKHPDQPKKPLTPFFRYFMEKRTKNDDPTVSVTDLAKSLSKKFASLSEKKKKKYKDEYEKEFAEYKKKVEVFKRNHPELELEKAAASNSAAAAKAASKNPEGPAKPKTPMQLFMDVKGAEPIQGMDKKQQMDKLKDDWNKLKETKRIKWIRRALEDEARYVQELHEYKEKNPSFEVPTVRGVLNKAEKALKDKFDGKPEKPPGSGYSLFSQIMLRQLKSSNEGMDSKEKMIHIAKRWKELSQEERDSYSNDVQVHQAKWAEKFSAYLQKLPESERAKAALENKVRLPSVKKLKKLEQAKQEDNRSIEDLDKDQIVNQAAFKLFQQEKVVELQAKGVPITELIDSVYREWSKLKMSKKGKYLKKAAASCPVPSKTSAQGSASPKKGKKVAKSGLLDTVQAAASTSDQVEERKKNLLVQLLKKAPETPKAASGYALFTQQNISKLTNIDPKLRMSEVSRLWKNLSKDQQLKMNDKVKEDKDRYAQQMAKFKKTLTSEEVSIYEEYLKNPKSKAKKRSDVKKSNLVNHNADPVVDDGNVVQEFEIETSRHEDNDDSDEEDDEEEDDDEDEDSDDESEDEEPAVVVMNSSTNSSKKVAVEESSDDDDDDDDEDDSDDDSD